MCVGDEVLLERSGDVIPKIVRVVREGNERLPFVMPSTCPVCGSEVVREEGEVVARCINNSCKARLKQSIEHFAHRSAMDIEGIGERVVEQLVDDGLVRDIADLYALKEKERELAALKKDSTLTPKKAEGIVAAIQKARAADWGTLLGALAIPGVGPATAKVVAGEFRERASLQRAPTEDLAAVKGVSSRAAKEIKRFLDDPHSQSLLDDLHEAGLQSVAPVDSGRSIELAQEPDPGGESDRAEAAKLKLAISRFAQRMGLKGKDRGLGDLLIAELVDDKTLRSQADLFRLQVADLTGRGSVRLGSKSAKKILAGLEKSKQARLGSLLFGLGIRYVGDRTAALLASHFRSMRKIAEASKEQLEEVEEVGPNIAEAIKRFFDSDKNKALIERLRESGLRFEEEEVEQPVSRPFEGKVFVITGTLSDMTRAEAKSAIQQLGGRVTGSVSGRTKFLLAGEKAGSKLAKAQRLNVSVIDEGELRNLAGEAWSSVSV